MDVTFRLCVAAPGFATSLPRPTVVHEIYIEYIEPLVERDANAIGPSRPCEVGRVIWVWAPIQAALQQSSGGAGVIYFRLGNIF